MFMFPSLATSSFLKSRFLLPMEDIGLTLSNCINGNKCMKMSGSKDFSLFFYGFIF